MTHFTVIVFDDGSNIKSLLEKYDEQLKVPEYPVVVSDKELEDCARFYRKENPEFEKVEDIKEIFLENSKSWCGCRSHINPVTKKVEYFTTYNPLSKYDYYTVGKVCGKSGLPKFVPYAFVTPEGEWISQGKMGWWAMSIDDMTDEEWEKIWKDAVKNYKGKFTWLDCHI